MSIGKVSFSAKILTQGISGGAKAEKIDIKVMLKDVVSDAKSFIAEKTKDLFKGSAADELRIIGALNDDNLLQEFFKLPNVKKLTLITDSDFDVRSKVSSQLVDLDDSLAEDSGNSYVINMIASLSHRIDYCDEYQNDILMMPSFEAWDE